MSELPPSEPLVPEPWLSESEAWSPPIVPVMYWPATLFATASKCPSGLSTMTVAVPVFSRVRPRSERKPNSNPTSNARRLRMLRVAAFCFRAPAPFQKASKALSSSSWGGSRAKRASAGSLLLSAAAKIAPDRSVEGTKWDPKVSRMAVRRVRAWLRA